MSTVTPNATTGTATVAGQSVKMNDSQFERLRKIIYQRSGIWFADSKRYILESRLGHRLAELDIENFDQYAMLLDMGPYKEDEFQEMFNRITINETSFFRNQPQLDVFERQILAELLERRRDNKHLRIWSAASSTGEEPYTLAILLHRSLGLRLADWKIEILATDISEKVLAAAQVGRYTSYSIRGSDQVVVNRYFKQDGSYYDIDPEIKSMVSFEKLNLKDRFAARRHGTFDVIFCRNVMIYFDQEMRQNCHTMFHEMLADDGALLVGHSESIRENTQFEPRPEPQSFAYHKVNREV